MANADGLRDQLRQRAEQNVAGAAEERQRIFDGLAQTSKGRSVDEIRQTLIHEWPSNEFRPTEADLTTWAEALARGERVTFQGKVRE